VKCRTKYCRGRTAKRHHSPFCPACQARRWKEKHPVSYYYHKLKTSARRRGKLFTLTKDKFAELWHAGMSANHGRTKFCLSVNRIKDHLGYTDDNVELLTVSENSRRRFVPFFANQAAEDAAIAETSRQIAEAYPECVTP